MSCTGEVVTLAEGAIDFAELRLVTQTLVTAAFSAAAAHLLALSLTAGTEILVVHLTLLALAAGSQVSGLTAAHPTAVSAGRVAAAAVGLGEIRAATITVVVHRDLKMVFKTNRPDGETLPGAFRRTSSCLYSYVEGDSVTDFEVSTLAEAGQGLAVLAGGREGQTEIFRMVPYAQLNL